MIIVRNNSASHETFYQDSGETSSMHSSLLEHDVFAALSGWQAALHGSHQLVDANFCVTWREDHKSWHEAMLNSKSSRFYFTKNVCQVLKIAPIKAIYPYLQSGDHL